MLTAQGNLAAKGLSITPGGVNCRLALDRNLNLSELVRFLNEHAHEWPSVTEYDARHDFPSTTMATEMRGIDAYRARFPHAAYRWPKGQSTHVDQLEDDQRQQFKTLRELSNHSGFRCHMQTRNGHDHDGRPLFVPYPADAFDVLVCVWFAPDGTAHFWRIPADELMKHGVFATDKQPGKKSLTVYGPPGIGKQPTKKADTWTRSYYVTPAA